MDAMNGDCFFPFHCTLYHSTLRAPTFLHVTTLVLSTVWPFPTIAPRRLHGPAFLHVTTLVLSVVFLPLHQSILRAPAFLHVTVLVLSIAWPFPTGLFLLPLHQSVLHAPAVLRASIENKKSTLPLIAGPVAAVVGG